MKKFKFVALMLALIFSLQIAACAATVQPRGRYLQSGSCSIAAGDNCVTISGQTDAYQDVDEISVTVTILKEVSSGYFRAVWSDTATATDDCQVVYTNTTVAMEPGYRYMVEATHTVKHNGVTETNYSEAGYAYVY